eukprot:CAMPEP_0184861870 /NCGR_PEP_ID=MMETSP0580-20130426/6460_1 /TAXON_ID=1118495 /ORGANISM="Dactyliosolen fragilissimus" /LENGTH=120 /DNA_ID=CAMNT_0027359525 /DNA_START=322 /DNA_END=684 /DNA_ORIENTATION=-
MEDKETATTEVFLSEDGTVTFGETDGPKHVAASGSWEQGMEDASFQMNIRRTFSAGKSGTSLGDFDFAVERTFKGLITWTGGLACITGNIICQDDKLGDFEVGYFSMIDTTAARDGEFHD